MPPNVTISPSSTQIFASPTERSPAETETPSRGFRHHSHPIDSSPPTHSELPTPPISTSTSRVDIHDHKYLPPGPSDCRSPCPALNTLANHGYLPRDGKNIHISDLLRALQSEQTYWLSCPLAELLARGGLLLMDNHDVRSWISVLFQNGKLACLHDLALHNKIEHSASISHRDAGKGQRFAPTRTDTALLNHFLKDHAAIEMAHIARQRVALERVSPLDGVHAEIARGEWALVLEVFGRKHGGKIPTDELRVWLYENRFPDGWKPDHKQDLPETRAVAKNIRDAMQDLCENAKWQRQNTQDAELAGLLKSECEAVNTQANPH